MGVRLQGEGNMGGVEWDNCNNIINKIYLRNKFAEMSGCQELGVRGGIDRRDKREYVWGGAVVKRFCILSVVVVTDCMHLQKPMELCPEKGIFYCR